MEFDTLIWTLVALSVPVWLVVEQIYSSYEARTRETESAARTQAHPAPAMPDRGVAPTLRKKAA
jgi:hypothetical protein